MNPVRLRSQRGLSLVELMIAVTLSSLLILGLVEIFASTRSAYAASEALARVQENGRFAAEFLRRDTRMVGQMGCFNEFAHIGTDPPGFYNHFGDGGATTPYPMRAQFSIEAYDYTGTVPGGTFAIASTNPPTSPSGAGWTPALPAELGLIGGAGGVINGSDVLVVRYLDNVPMHLPFPGLNSVSGELPLEAADAPSIVQFAAYGLTNCRSVSLFQVTSSAGAGTVVATNGGRNVPVLPGEYWSGNENYNVGVILHRFRAHVYYIGQGANGPGLFRKSLYETPASALEGVAFAPAEEMVEGIEMMQLLLGVTPTLASGRTDDIVTYQSPQVLLNGLAVGSEQAFRALRRVGAVRVALLGRSPAGALVGNPELTTMVVGDVIVTPPQDQRLRKVYEAHIGLRNRQRG